MSRLRSGRILIIGLGLIGGSLAKALKTRAKPSHIAAFDVNRKALETAESSHWIDEAVDRLETGIPRADLVVWALPVGKICAGLKEYAGSFRPGQVVTDVGSVKRQIMDAAKALPGKTHFIGGHPMAGKEVPSWAASDSDLFYQRPWVLTPDESKTCSEDYQQALRELESLILTIGAIPVSMHAAEHDKSAALLSHLPQLISSCLMNTVGTLIDELPTKDLLAAGGLRDTTRIAGSNPQMWQEIYEANREELIGLIEIYEEQLKAAKKCLVQNDFKGIYNLLQRAQKYRNSIW